MEDKDKYGSIGNIPQSTIFDQNGKYYVEIRKDIEGSTQKFTERKIHR